MRKKKSGNILKKSTSALLVAAMLLTSLPLGNAKETVNADEELSTIYFVDNSDEKWVGNDDARICLVDNSHGHVKYDMSKVDDVTWEVSVPESASNVTFNRLDDDTDTQWNSWSAGGKDDKNVYFADGAEYGHWGYDDELKEQYFHAGDVVYVDINEFENWRNSNAVLYVNFNEAAKKNSQDIILADADKSIWNPKTVDYEQEKNVFAYVITKEDEGRNVLRFWRGNDTTLWNCSVKLTYKDFSKGKNVVKIKDWNNQGVLEKRDFEINFEADKDNDSLCDYIETVLGLDKNSADTDNDGLTDGEEITITKTDAAVYDSYQSGVADGDVDMDGDGLTNKEEISYGSDPNLKDTDNDDIDDYTEVNEYKTKPADESLIN